MTERFTIWVQIEGAADDRDEWNIGLPDRLATFETEDEARRFLTRLMRDLGSRDVATSEQVSRPVAHEPAVCAAQAAATGYPHYCAGCGRCMVFGCDGRFKLHGWDCGQTVCARCDGQFEGAGEADPCLCDEPAVESPFCEWCGELLSQVRDCPSAGDHGWE